MGGVFKEFSQAFWKKLIGQQEPSSSRKIATIIIIILGFLLTLITGIVLGVINDDLRSYYVHWIYRNEQISINVMSISREYGPTHLVLNDNTPTPVSYEGFLIPDKECIQAYLVNVRPTRITDDDKVVPVGDFCIFTFPINFVNRDNSAKRLTPLSFTPQVPCIDCIENEVAIQHYGTKSINNFFTRICIAGGTVKIVEGDNFRKSSDNCVEINLPTLNPGQLIKGKFTIIDYSGKSAGMSFEGYSDEQGQITQDKFIHVGAILLANCDGTNVTNKERLICAKS